MRKKYYCLFFTPEYFSYLYVLLFCPTLLDHLYYSCLYTWSTTRAVHSVIQLHVDCQCAITPSKKCNSFVDTIVSTILKSCSKIIFTFFLFNSIFNVIFLNIISFFYVYTFLRFLLFVIFFITYETKKGRHVYT